MTATTQEGAELVRAFYTLIQEGKFEEALGMLHEEIVVHSPAGLPYGGDHRGVEGFMSLGGQLLGLVDAGLAAPAEYHQAGDLVIAKFPSFFTSKASGERVEMDVVELITCRDGKIADIDVYYKRPEDLAGFAPG